MKLNERQVLMLRVAAGGGASGTKLMGTGWWRTARALVRLGLGEIEGKIFTATEAGLAAIAMHVDA